MSTDGLNAGPPEGALPPDRHGGKPPAEKKVRRLPAGASELQRALFEAPEAFDFFQAVRRLESCHKDKPRIGHSYRASDDPVRFGQDPSLAFASRTLERFDPGVGGAPDRLSSNFLGLFGPNGPLPLHLTEFARDRIRHFDDPTMVAFANIFHHRIFSLFYRAWAEARPTSGFDRPGEDRFAFYIASLSGHGLKAAADRDAMPDLAKRHFVGRLGLQTRNAEGLEAICRSFFKIPVRIEQFIGEWLVLPAHQLCRLGQSRATGRLGVNATLGGRVWSCQHKFRLVFGPMTLEDYRRFLPGSGSLERLVAIVRNYAGDELAWDVNLVLLGDERPQLKLGRQGRLGWTTWLPSRAGKGSDRRDLFLDPLPEIE